MQTHEHLGFGDESLYIYICVIIIIIMIIIIIIIILYRDIMRNAHICFRGPFAGGPISLLGQSQPFHLLVSLIWSTFSKGCKR